MDNQQPSNNIFYQKPKKGCGFIYKYTAPNGKSYIGQTINTLACRAGSIVSGKGYKKCSLFWKAINKYGFTKFKVEILIEVPYAELNRLETQYISKYNTLSPYGYNLTNSGKQIDVYTYSAQNGLFLEHYNSLSEASLMTGVPVSTISSILSDKTNRRIVHNLTFTRQYIDAINLLELARNNYCNIYVYNQDGYFLKEYVSIASASRDLKIADCTIRRHLENEQITCGYYFRKNKQDKIETPNKSSKIGYAVRQIDPNTMLTILIYCSLASAARAVGLASSSAITRAIKRNGKAKGFYWSVIEGSTTKSE